MEKHDSFFSFQAFLFGLLNDLQAFDGKEELIYDLEIIILFQSFRYHNLDF